MRKQLLLLVITALVLFNGCSMLSGKLPGESDKATALETTAQEAESMLQDKAEEKPIEKTNIEKQDMRDALSITLYYQTGDGYIVPVSRRIVKQEGIARAALNGLIDNAVNRETIGYYGIYPVLPAGTEILGLNIKEGTATVDFNEQLLNYEDQKAENNIIASIVYTLTEFKTVNDVRILVNGNESQKLKFESDISGTLSRKNLMINSGSVNLGDGSEKADIYLFKRANDSYTYLLPVSVDNSQTSGKDSTEKIINLLSGYDPGENLYSEIPQGMELNGSKIASGLLTLDLSADITSGGGNAHEEGMIKQLLYSMKQIDGVGKVKILVDGSVPSLPEGNDLSGAIPVPATINDVIDGERQE